MQKLYLTAVDLERRFFSKVEMTDTCWLWTGTLQFVSPENRRRGIRGYGEFVWPGHVEKQRMAAHRWSYEFFKGPIPNGLTIDHLCRVTRCVNPNHLEAVTLRENLQRRPTWVGPYSVGDYCRHGHLREGNTRINTKGARVCRVCQKLAVQAHYERKRALSIT